VKDNLGLGGNGENWIGGRLNGDDVRLVKDEAALGCIFTGVAPLLVTEVSCVVGGACEKRLAWLKAGR
jgi:hypothetical protein